MRLLILFFFLNALIINAQNEIDFEYDYAQFAYDSVSNYVEFYYSFGQPSLNKKETDSVTLLEGVLDIAIKDSASLQPVVDKQWRISHPAGNNDSLPKNLIGVIGFLLEKGSYQCSVGGRDTMNSENKKYYNDYIRVNPFIREKISISDLQLASKILQDSENESSVFYKNTYEIIPLPATVLGENQPVLFHYFELYNLHEDSDHVLKLNTIVVNSSGKVIWNKPKELSPSVNSRVEVGTVPVNKFPTDSYTLIVTLIDSIDNYGVSSTKKFYVYNPSVKSSDTLSSGISPSFASQFGSMSEDELDDLFNKSKYIASSGEVDKYEALSTVEGKREFLFQFWNQRDQDPSTPRNEYYIDYMERVQRSDHQFRALGKKGWQTDRGRVLIKYGEPNEIERYPNEIDKKPYEIWYYHEIEGGVVFVFADLTNFSDYMLIHSTARGELRDESWTRRIGIL